MKPIIFFINILLCAICLIFSTTGYSQNSDYSDGKINHFKDITSTIFFEDFEDGIPSGFILYDGDGLTPYYSFVDNAWIEYEGTALSTSYYQPPGIADDWMITPGIFIPENALLQWDAVCSDIDYPDGYEVRISLDGTSPADFTNIIFSTSAEENIWVTHNIDLNSLGFANQIIYLAFRNNSNDGWFLLVDNIKIYTIEQFDAGVAGFLDPQSGCNLSDQEDVTINIKNYGYDTIFSLQVVYSVDGIPVTPETINDTILPFESINYTFNTKADLTGIADRVFDSYTIFPSDTDPANDELNGYTVNTGVDIATVNYEMGFEEDDFTEFGLWNINDGNNDLNTWNMYESVYGNFMYFDFSEGAGDDWLVSRCFTFDPAKIYEVSFWYLAANSNEIKNLYLVRGTAQDPGSLYDTITAIEAIPNLGYFVWAHTFFTVTSGEANFFGIHCTGNAANQEAVYIDNFEIREVPPLDIGVIYQTFPVSGCEMTDSENLIIAIYNYGYQAVDQFSAAYSLNGVASSPVLVNQNINPGDTLFYTFPSTIDLSLFGNYNISTYTLLAADGYNTNDSFQTQVYSAFDFSTGNYGMGFEPEDNFFGWNTFNINNDNGLWIMNLDYYPHTGINSAAYIYSSNNQADDYLVSRCFYFEASKHYMISFWYAVLSSNYPEKLSLYLVADQGPDKSPPAFLDLGEITNEEYLKAQKGFQVDEDGVYIFQWKAYSDPDMYFIFLDDIEIHQIDCSSPYVTPIELGNDTTLNSGGSVMLNAGTGFQEYSWSNGQSTQTIMVNQSGVYSVTALDTCLRESTDEIQVNILQLNENEALTGINIFPNPAHSELIIETNNPEIKKAELYNITGKKVLVSGYFSGNITLNVSDLTSGLYMIRVISKDKYFTGMITIE